MLGAFLCVGFHLCFWFSMHLLHSCALNVQHGWTALHKAAFHGDLECAKILLQGAATLDIQEQVRCLELLGSCNTVHCFAVPQWYWTISMQSFIFGLCSCKVCLSLSLCIVMRIQHLFPRIHTVLHHLWSTCSANQLGNAAPVDEHHYFGSHSLLCLGV